MGGRRRDLGRDQDHRFTESPLIAGLWQASRLLVSPSWIIWIPRTPVADELSIT